MTSHLHAICKYVLGKALRHSFTTHLGLVSVLDWYESKSTNGIQIGPVRVPLSQVSRRFFKNLRRHSDFGTTLEAMY